MKTLLQKARAIKHDGKWSRKITNEQVELSLAWLRGDIGVSQVQAALGKKTHGAIYAWMTVRLKEAFSRGRLVIPKK